MHKKKQSNKMNIRVYNLLAIGKKKEKIKIKKQTHHQSDLKSLHP